MKNKDGQERAPLTWNDKLFAAGLYLAIGASCISNVRLTPSGPKFFFEGGGYPYLYEFGVAIAVFMGVFSFFFHQPPVLTGRQKIALGALCVFYLPIFVNYVFLTYSIKAFIGGGQLRLQLEAWLLGVVLLAYPLKARIFKGAVIVVMAMAMANALYAICSFYGLLEPLYKISTGRISWRIRYSGFFDMPSRLGALSAASIALALYLPRKSHGAILVFAACSAAVFLADSRTGMVSVAVVLLARAFSIRKLAEKLSLAFVHLAAALGTILFFMLPEFVWTLHHGRSERIAKAVEVWMQSPFGVPWGLGGIYPHNWPAMSLLHGGIVSFLVVAGFHFWLLKKYMKFRGARSSQDRLIASALLALIAVCTSSYFEQIFLEAHALMTFMVCLSLTVQLEETHLGKKGCLETPRLFGR